MALTEIDWPDGYRPEDCPVHSRNEIFIPAPREEIWRRLIRADHWHEWYGNCRNLEFERGAGPDLAMGTAFRWTTFCVRVASRVERFAPCESLGWNATAFGARGYHGWVIQSAQDGFRVVTEEVQRGFIPFIARRLLKWALERYHQRWLEGLRDRSQSGPL